MKTKDPMSPQPHVSNTRFRQAIKKYFYKDIEPEYTQYIENLIINGSIESLDTLKELAEAIGNDPNFFGDVNARFNEVELVTSAALNDLNSKKQDNLESGVNIKTVNGFSLVGSGDVAIGTYRGIPASWDTNHTMADLIDSIAADTSAVPGESYMGTVHLSDLPENMIQAELIIEVMDQLGSNKTVAFQLASADTSPYKWEYVSAYGATGVWRSWIPASSNGITLLNEAIEHSIDIDDVGADIGYFGNDDQAVIEIQNHSVVIDAVAVDNNTGYNSSFGVYPDNVTIICGETTFLVEDNSVTIDGEEVATQTWVSNQGYLTAHQDISGKEDKMTIEAVASPGATLTAEIGKYYTMSNVGTMTITLPAGSGTKTQTIVFYISTASTTNIDFTSTSTVYKSKGFTIDADSTYEINALWNGVAWVIGQMEIEILSS